MATVPRTTPLESIEYRFKVLADRWRAETSHLSSSTAIANHPAYQEIIDLGVAVVPLILSELKNRPEPWFHALKAITGADPVLADDRGRVDRMARAWLQWGKENGINGKPD